MGNIFSNNGYAACLNKQWKKEELSLRLLMEFENLC